MISPTYELKGSPNIQASLDNGVAVLRFDTLDKPINVISKNLATELEEILSQIDANSSVRAVVLCSAKPGCWIAGADIDQFVHLNTAEDGEALSQGAHRLFSLLEALRVPVVAAIDGVALGGGLELALACTYRVASDSSKTKLGLPEVQLGILPGAGGTQRLPRLVGIRASLDLMLTGKNLDARRAKKLGIVDEVVPPSILLDVAQRAALEIADKTRRPRTAARSGSPQWIENLPGLRTFIFRKAREGVMTQTHGLYPAPLKILEVVEKSIDMPLHEGLSVEARAFGELTVSPESRSLVHIFFTSTAAKNSSTGSGAPVPPEIRNVTVVGAGFMGSGVAVVTAESGIRVRLKDVTPEAVAKGLKNAYQSLTKRAEKKKKKSHEITEILDRVEGTTSYNGLKNTGLVIEAVFEDLDLKHRIVREVEAAGSQSLIFGTNTSTIPIREIAAASARPEQVIGVHFFSPVEKMPLLEIITTPETSGSVIASVHAYAKKIGKTPIIVGDAPGFYVNRILTPYMAEAALLLEQGVPMEDIDKAMVAWGFPVGPVTLYDEVGLDVAYKAGKVMAASLGERMMPSALIERMVQDGRLGRKNGRGFYRYESGSRSGPDASASAVIGSSEPTSISQEEIQDRLSLLLLNEAVRTLEEGVLRCAGDGDVGAVFGIGFPAFRGGPFWYIDQMGADTIVARLRALEERFGDRYSPANLLVAQAESAGRFCS